MSNPYVREHLELYPEDAGPRLESACQGSRWLHDMDPGLLTPMHRISGTDFYIYEPAMLVDGRFCIPTRWFRRKGYMYARAWELTVVNFTDYKGELHRWWEVHEERHIDVPERLFLKNFVSLQEQHIRFGVPHPALLLRKS
jgi:hypothetical protein